METKIKLKDFLNIKAKHFGEEEIVIFTKEVHGTVVKSKTINYEVLDNEKDKQELNEEELNMWVYFFDVIQEENKTTFEIYITNNRGETNMKLKDFLKMKTNEEGSYEIEVMFINEDKEPYEKTYDIVDNKKMTKTRKELTNKELEYEVRWYKIETVNGITIFKIQAFENNYLENIE